MFKFKRKQTGSLLSEQKEDLLDDVEESTHEMVPRNRSKSSLKYVNKEYNVNSINTNDDDESKKKNRKYSYCSWKCWCLTSTLTFSLIIVILIMILFLNIAPQFAQNTLDNASMDIINGTIYNPTNSSITLNTTIIISNAGFLDGKIDSTTVTVTNNGIKIGTMTMPSFQTKANTNTILAISTVLQITNKTQFQKSCKQLLQNQDQTWHISANNAKLTVDTNIIGKINYHVNLNKNLILKGAKLYNFIASDFNIASATESTITTISNLNFISDSTFTFHIPNTILSAYYKNIYIGYASISSLSMKPGFNTLYNQSLIIESYSSQNNRHLLGEFFGNYVSGINQQLILKGPISSTIGGYSVTATVIDGILEQILTALGYTKGNLAFGGLVTSATQQGWKVNGKTIRGAYADFLNPLNVPLRIVDMSGVAKLPETLKYHVTIVTGYDCEESVFASLSIGEGIWKENVSKTWVDVNANDKVTYFQIVDPPKDAKPDTCILYPFSCCFATLSAAYACWLNPGIQKHPSNGQLTSDYMPLILEANVSLLIDHKFMIDISMNQDFLPLHFGWQVYGGYALDLELSCNSFTFK